MDVVNKKHKGIVRECQKLVSAKQKTYFKIYFESIVDPFYLWKDEGFNVGDEIEIEYNIKQHNGKDYFNVDKIINIIPIKPTETLKEQVKEAIQVPSENIDKMSLENDRLNRKVTLIKCAFDYGNRKNMEYPEIINVYNQLTELLK